MKRILVVDDNSAILDVLEILLSEEGYKVKCVDDASDFLPVVIDFEPQLIILDIQLGRYDGRALCDNLKGLGNTKDIPVLLMSAKVNIRDMGVYTCTAQEFITKPFDIDDVVRRVSSHINR
ncbi:response regulator [Pedobacter mucosus]|uniref:response regulator n=1 Tax=Pedobacter mucosus TaxID=2895286 RepID=UPI001EE3B8EE|nr:response regulator [Pedobacter mucosus]UKT63044.1 response regulator [Pedobacter mucosus]